MKKNNPNIYMYELKEFINNEYNKKYIIYEYHIQELKELTEEFQTKYRLNYFNHINGFVKVIKHNEYRVNLNETIDKIFEDLMFLDTLNRSLFYNNYYRFSEKETKTTVFDFFKKSILNEDDDLLSQERKHEYIEKFHKLLEHFLIDSK